MIYSFLLCASGSGSSLFGRLILREHACPDYTDVDSEWLIPERVWMVVSPCDDYHYRDLWVLIENHASSIV
jgi:hypothetical protein